MIGIPSLFAKDPRTRLMNDAMIPLAQGIVRDWTPMELLPGADVRLTVRNHTVVRLEVSKQPDVDQRKEGIFDPWYKDVPVDDRKGGYWLWKAVEGTDLSDVPDGEWAGEAIGENINKNSMGMEGHTIVFSSLFPWRNTLNVPVPPELERTPLGFDELRFWLATTPTSYPGAGQGSIPMGGVVWWLDYQPIAQVRAKDFPPFRKTPSGDKLPETVMSIEEVIDWENLG